LPPQSTNFGAAFAAPERVDKPYFREKFHFDYIAVPGSVMPVSALASVSDGRLPPAIIAPDGAAMKFFADFMPFSARYCIIAVRARRRIYGLGAIDSKQYLAEN